MLDELMILQEMLGDLTNAGIWGVCIFVGYKLIVFGGTLSAIVYVVRLVVTKLYEFNKSPITKLEAEELKADELKARNELNEVKSMYKILKQKYEDKDNE
jgi:hypothetical protein